MKPLDANPTFVILGRTPSGLAIGYIFFARKKAKKDAASIHYAKLDSSYFLRSQSSTNVATSYINY